VAGSTGVRVLMALAATYGGRDRFTGIRNSHLGQLKPTRDWITTAGPPPPGPAVPVSYQVNWEIQALDQTAGFLRDDPIGVAALWDTVGQLADEPRPPTRVTRANGAIRAIGGTAPWYPCK
jgi:hypothetical protein